MVKGCCALVSQSRWWNVISRLLCLDAGDDNNGDDVAELFISPQDADYDDDVNEGTELLVRAYDGLRADNVLSILQKNPGLLRVADPVGDTVLHVAARAGDIDTMCQLIVFFNARSVLNRLLIDRNVDGDTPLHVAVKNRHNEVAYHLAIAQGQLVYIRNNDGKYAHQLAEEAGYNELCEVLDMPFYGPESGLGDVATLRLSEDAESLAYFESAILSKSASSNAITCSSGDVELRVVREDLMGMSKRAPVLWMEIYNAIQQSEENALATVLTRVRDGKKLLWYHGVLGRTLLHEAVKVSGQGPLKQVVQFMISDGLTDAALLKDDSGDTALHLAVYSEQLSKALDLIKMAPRAAYQVNNMGDSPLYLAVKNNYQDLVMNMFDMLSRSSVPGYASEIPLHPKNATLAHLAIKSSNLGTLQILMEHIPELINKTNKRGWRPLSYAANIGHLEAVNYLLTNFPKSTEKVDIDGSLPIHKAVGGGKVSIIEAFLSHCPRALHHVDKQGRSVLHIAVRYARADILDYLNKNIKMDDSFLNLKDNQGKTCMDHATRN